MTINAATQSSSLFGALPLFALLLAGVALLRWNRRSKASVEPQLDQLEHDLDLIRGQILLITTDNVPDRRIVKTIGYVEDISEIEAASDWEYRIAEKDALLRMARKAKNMGANAVIGIRKINAHYDQAGSQWRVSRVAYCGTAVVSVNSRMITC